MTQLELIIERLKEAGLRRTRLRTAVLELLLASPAPLSVPEIQRQLAGCGLAPNKTSMYREVEALVRQGIAEEALIAGVRKAYIAQTGHHHHVVCTSCNRTQCVDLPGVEDALREPQSPGAAGGFSITGHDLTLYGLCPECLPL